MWFVLIWFTVIEFDNIVWQQFGFPQVLSRMISQTNVTKPLMLECIKHGADAFDAFDDVLFVCVSMTIDVRDYLGGSWGPWPLEVLYFRFYSNSTYIHIWSSILFR